MYDFGTPALQSLLTQLEDDWVTELYALGGLDRVDLPLLWDADFLYGSRTDSGADTHLLCETNVRSVLPHPDAHLRRWRRRCGTASWPAAEPHRSCLRRPPTIGARGIRRRDEVAELLASAR